MVEPEASHASILAGAVGLIAVLFGSAAGGVAVGQLARGPEQACDDCGGGPGPLVLSDRESREVFGYGDALGVTVQAKDELHFVFDFAESIPVAYFVRFEARGIDRREQVEITLNGAHVGYVEPGEGDYAKSQRFKLPKEHLRRGETNELVFDHADNPPGDKPWAVSKVRLLVRRPAMCPGDACVREAKKACELVNEHLAAGEGGHFRAWAELHRCLLLLESVEPKPELYSLANATLRDLDRSLDARCRKTLAAGKRWEGLREPRKALREYENGLAWFPESDDAHPCRGKLQDRIADLVGAGR